MIHSDQEWGKAKSYDLPVLILLYLDDAFWHSQTATKTKSLQVLILLYLDDGFWLGQIETYQTNKVTS